MPRAWYAASIEEFVESRIETIFGTISRNCGGDIDAEQNDAWARQIDFLQAKLGGLRGTILFEYAIPRMGRRVDVVLLVGAVVFVVEFKVHSATFDRGAIEQVWDYALDLKNFHEASHHAPIVPILLATEAPRTAVEVVRDPDGVYRPIPVALDDFREVLDRMLGTIEGPTIDGKAWLRAPYRPTPTIVEAARALYAQHSVESIARSDAGAQNLAVTSQHIEDLVEEAKRTRRKVVCFVTGVPGAGKTLVGLNVATQSREEEHTDPAVYLSGNGPLVEVLREALARDEFSRRKADGASITKTKIKESVKAFIQNVHHFRDDALADRDNAPAEHVAIFDEAQRAWNREKASNWMRRKKNVVGFSQSEPEFLIETMDRHDDWAVVVCLVGGGQEINEGEAGIDAWLNAVTTTFPDWRMHISSRLTDSEYAAGNALDFVRNRPGTVFDDSLHLAVSMRSFRAENVSEFVKALLDREIADARSSFERLADKYPIVLTRDLDAAKEWVRSQSRGSERYGLLASSNAFRLKPHAIDVRAKINPIHWFLNGRDDTRSSWYLEDAATEFQVQGLELDWTCVTWDGDLRFDRRGWGYHNFKGSKWQNVKKSENRQYLLNAYRVLLTRARQGMVIFVPPGNRSDPTRPPENYDATAQYLREVGLPELR
ncbi:MAG: DUF2075 domain-containing protein [Acidobacteria bacterium]|nr:DUF2075 domain-containing protein [Acidobacteriota bacterium]